MKDRKTSFVSLFRKTAKVAEHIFQVPMPKYTITFKLFMLWLQFFLQESRLITEVFILEF